VRLGSLRLGATGRFFEADQTDRRNDCRSAHRACRGGEPTIAASPIKLDYIFFSNTLATGLPGALSGGVIASESSDHHLLRGWAVMKGTARP
jgi:endonuclease/exonuclease/phosphatase family metal-dependent hydrolase